MKWLFFISIMYITSFAQNPVDDINWANKDDWNCIKNIYVKPLIIGNTFKGDQPASHYQECFLSVIGNILKGQKGIENVVVATPGCVFPPNSAIVEGTFLKLTAGSKAARFWVGFGVGSSWCQVSIKGYASDTKDNIFSITHQRGSAMGLQGDELEENVTEVATDIATALLSTRTACILNISPKNEILSPLPVISTSMLVPLAILSEPPGSEVSIDGHFVGTTPLPDFKCEVGSHYIKIQTPGFISWQKDIMLFANSPSQISIKLNKLE